MLKAGFAKLDITPTGPVPLAGYFSLRPRMSKEVRDPLYVRALALQEGNNTLVLISYDLLLITEQMVRGVNGRLKETGAQVILHATHTHSGSGGYWNTFAARLALGHYLPAMLPFLCDQGARAAWAALDDLSPAGWATHTGHIPALAKNRRDRDGLVDDGLWALKIQRPAPKSDKAILVGFSGHPVIVAERQPNALSADFPGEVIRRIEEQTDFGMFVNGALGGVDVLFPDEPMEVDRNLELQAAPIVTEALGVLKKRTRKTGELRMASRTIEVDGRPDVAMAFDEPRWLRKVTRPLDWLASAAFARADLEHWHLQGFALGDTCFIGTPADLGVGVSLAIQVKARAKGYNNPFVASQCDGYIGYIHRRHDYHHPPAKGTRSMAIYENVMGIFGREMGERLIHEADALLDELSV